MKKEYLNAQLKDKLISIFYATYVFAGLTGGCLYIIIEFIKAILSFFN